MSDLIDRDETIKQFCKQDCGCDPKDCLDKTCYEVEIIESVPTHPTPSNTLGALDCVSRQDAIDALAVADAKKGWRSLKLSEMYKCLSALPSVQPKERCIANITLNEEDLEKIVKEQVEEIKELLPQKGEWIWDGDIFDLEKEYICSECRCYALRKDGNQIRSNFCPNCGADMREEINDEN